MKSRKILNRKAKAYKLQTDNAVDCNGNMMGYKLIHMGLMKEGDYFCRKLDFLTLGENTWIRARDYAVQGQEIYPDFVVCRPE